MESKTWKKQKTKNKKEQQQKQKQSGKNMCCYKGCLVSLSKSMEMNEYFLVMYN